MRREIVKKQKTIKVVGGGALLLFFIYIVVQGYGAPEAVERIVIDAALPVLTARSAAYDDAQGFFGTFRAKRTLLEENRVLREQLREAHAQLFDRNVLQQENSELKTLFGRTEGREFILARVLLRPGSTPYDTLLIDVGVRNGIQVGDTILVGGTVLLGVVEEVLGSSSRVRLVSSSGIETEAFFRKSQARVTLEGIGGGNFIAEVPQDMVVEIGEEVVVPGIHGYVMGIVGALEDNTSDAFQTIRIQTPINIYTVQSVLIERAS